MTNASATAPSVSSSSAASGAGGAGLRPLFDRLELVSARLDAELARLCAGGGNGGGGGAWAWLAEAQRRTGARYSHVFFAAAFFALALLFLGLGAHFFSLLVGFAYPAYASLKAVDAAERTEDKQWLSYWVIFGAFTVVEAFGDIILAIFPLYYSVKVLFLLYLQAPQLRGAEFVYNAFLRPLFQRNAPLIEARVSAFRDAGATIARAAGIDLAPAAAAAAGGGGGADAAEPTTADVFGPSRKEK